MRCQNIDQITYFESDIDPSLEGVQTWRSTLQVITDPTETYSERLSKAVGILKDFLSRADESPNINFKTGMEYMLNVLIHVTDFHLKLWSHCVAGLAFGPREPPSDLLRQYNDVWDKHASLEKLVDHSQRHYHKCLKKWTDIHEDVSGELSLQWLNYDKVYATITSKVDVALTKYQSHYRREVKHRGFLLKETEKLKPGFIDHEKNKINEIFNTLKELLCKMEILAPKPIRGVKELCSELNDMDAWQLAAAGWEACEKIHTFPNYEGPKDTDPTGPSEPILTVKNLKKDPCPTELFCVYVKSDTGSVTSGSNNECCNREKCKEKIRKETAPRRTRAETKRYAPPPPFSPESMSPWKNSRTTGGTKDECKGRPSKSKVKRFDSDRNVKIAKESTHAEIQEKYFQRLIRKIPTPKPKEDSTSVEDLRKGNHCGNNGDARSQKKQVASACSMTSTDDAKSTGYDVTTMYDVTVIALKDRVKQSSKEISIRAGMKIKQTKASDSDGMAYGYKRVKLGVKKYGLYPADLVSLYSKNAKD